MKLLFGGDIMLGRQVRAFTRQHGVDHPFSGIADLLATADLRMANLECVLVPDETAVPVTKKDMVTSFALAAGLVGRFDVLSLANNHILDYGGAAALATREACIRNGISPVGLGTTPAEARALTVLERGGERIGFLAYTEDTHSLGRQTHPGPAYLDETAMLADVAIAGKTVDHIVVSIHADLEYVNVPAPWRIELSRRLIEAGVTVVVGHHPHVPQGIERVGRGLVIHSLGNLVYDAPLRAVMLGASPDTARSMLVEVDLERRGVAAHRVHPLRIDATCRPVPVDGLEGDRLLADVQAWSDILRDPAACESAWQATCRRNFAEVLAWVRGFSSSTSPDEILGLLPHLLHDSQRHWVSTIVQGLKDTLPPPPPTVLE